MKSLGILIGIALAATLTLVPVAARADINFGTGSVVITPTSGNVNTDTVFLTSIATRGGDATATTGATYVFQNGVNMGVISATRTPNTPSRYGTFGFDGLNAFADRSVAAANPYVSDRLLNSTAVTLTSGAFELRYYWSGSVANLDLDSYVTLPMTYNASSGAWAVLPEPSPTTLSLTASASGTAVSLTATIRLLDTAAVASTASGSIVFTEGSVTVATVPVSGGGATAALANVAAGSHTFAAEYVPDYSFTFSASTSADASVIVSAGSGIGVTFDIAAGSNGGVLQLTSHDSIVALGTATVSGTTFNASGTLNAVVDDSRQAGSPDWNLTGVMADFTAPAVGTAPARTLSAKYLGWNPTVTAGSVGSAGAVVLPAPGSPSGLKTSSQLSYGSTSAADPQVTTTTVKALLQLQAPKNTAAGNYAGVLTLTLI